MRLCRDLGLGDYEYEDINMLGSMDSKIDILADLLNTAQMYHEHIFIEDDMCLVKSSEIVYWFEKVLKKLEKSYYYNNNKDKFKLLQV